jgi:hypothetical protein
VTIRLAVALLAPGSAPGGSKREFDKQQLFAHSKFVMIPAEFKLEGE